MIDNGSRRVSVARPENDLTDDNFSDDTIIPGNKRKNKQINLRKEVLYRPCLDNSLIVTSKTGNKSLHKSFDFTVSNMNFEIPKKEFRKIDRGEFIIKISPEKDIMEFNIEKNKKPNSLLSLPTETLKTSTNSKLCNSMDYYNSQGDNSKLESIEDVHINLVKLFNKSKSLVKLQESDFIDDHNFNTVVHFEEVDV
jgi:hypothetical protein